MLFHLLLRYFINKLAILFYEIYPINIYNNRRHSANLLEKGEVIGTFEAKIIPTSDYSDCLVECRRINLLKLPKSR